MPSNHPATKSRLPRPHLFQHPAEGHRRFVPSLVPIPAVNEKLPTPTDWRVVSLRLEQLDIQPPPTRRSATPPYLHRLRLKLITPAPDHPEPTRSVIISQDAALTGQVIWARQSHPPHCHGDASVTRSHRAQTTGWSPQLSHSHHSHHRDAVIRPLRSSVGRCGQSQFQNALLQSVGQLDDP